MTKKALIGLGALSAIAIGTLLVRKHFSTKMVDGALKKEESVVDELEQTLRQRATEQSPNKGKTVEETIANVFGKNSRITPHTYDTSKEFHTMHVLRDQAGYSHGIFNKYGIVPEENFKDYPDHLVISRSVTSPQLLKSAGGNQRVSMLTGTFKGTENKVVRLAIFDPTSRNGNESEIIFSLISPNNEFTPAQNDLLKLGKNPECLDTDVINKLTKFKLDYRSPKTRELPFEEACKQKGKYENLDYDLFLSAIQSMAKDV